MNLKALIDLGLRGHEDRAQRPRQHGLPFDAAHSETETKQTSDAKPASTSPLRPSWPGVEVDPWRTAPVSSRAHSAPGGGRAGGGDKRSRRQFVMGALGVLALGGVGIFAAQAYSRAAPAEAQETGTLVVESSPDGLELFIDGTAAGRTPARMALRPGAYTLELRGPGLPRMIPIRIAAGALISHHVDMPVAKVTGTLIVRSEPPGASVFVDRQPAGISPVTVTDLEARQHEVIVKSESAEVRETVTIQPGTTANLVVPLATRVGPVSGWLTVVAPFEMHLFEGGRLIGTSRSERIMMQAGRHDLEIVNDTLGYRATRSVDVAAGRVANVKVELPTGLLNLNAIPWAEAWLDGQPVGETPLANLSAPIGPHEIVFRHPQLGEKRVAVTVRVSGANRVSVDLRK